MTDIDRRHLDKLLKGAVTGFGLHYAAGHLSAPALWVRATTEDTSGLIAIAGESPAAFPNADPTDVWEHVAPVPVMQNGHQLRNWIREHMRRLPIMPLS